MRTIASRRLSSPGLSAALLKLGVAVVHCVQIHSLTKAHIARLNGDAKERALQESCWDNELASAISNRDRAYAESEADTANLSGRNVEHNNLMKDIGEDR